MRVVVRSRREAATSPRRPRRLLAAVVAAGLVLAAGAAEAQPFRFYLATVSGTASGFQVPHNPALNPTGQITVEAWVYHATTTVGGSCRNIAGKGYLSAWWIGICGDQLRSYIKGSNSDQTSGTIPAGQWTHVAVTYDGTMRRHYINGELVHLYPETGPLGTSTKPVDIGTDEDFLVAQPQTYVDEVRLWNVARTQGQIRSTINVRLLAPQTGLVAVWNFDEPGTEPIHGYNGVFYHGADVAHLPVFGGPCVTDAHQLCLLGRFSAVASFRTGPPGAAETAAAVVNCPNPGSGLFWFFSPDNWELMVKGIDGCAVNSRFWVFSAATTNVFYRLEILDIPSGEQRIYFNYPGPPAPAVTDTGAFANCP
jgi:hypothetical protein